MSSGIVHPRVTPKQAMEDSIRCIQAGIVPFLQSSPGIGKSSIAREIASAGKLKLIDLRLSQCAPEDLQGLPMKENGRAKFTPFDTFPLENIDAVPDGYNGWLLFLDEFNSASKGTQAAAYKLVLDRLVGNYALHPQCAIMAAGNLATDKAITTAMSTAMQSRVAHILIDVSHKEWVEWANQNQIDYRVVGFMHFQPQKLHQFIPDHADLTFACPRTWEFASKLSKGVADLKPMRALLSGVLSPGVAMEFVTFSEEYAKIPSLDEIIKSPDTLAVPKELSTRWAVITMMTAHIDDTNVEPLVKYASRFRPEEKMVFFRGVVARNHMLSSHPLIAGGVHELMKFKHNI